VWPPRQRGLFRWPRRAAGLKMLGRQLNRMIRSKATKDSAMNGA